MIYYTYALCRKDEITRTDAEVKIWISFSCFCWSIKHKSVTTMTKTSFPNLFYSAYTTFSHTQWVISRYANKYLYLFWQSPATELQFLLTKNCLLTCGTFKISFAAWIVSKFLFCGMPFFLAYYVQRQCKQNKIVADTTVISFWGLDSQIRVLLFFTKPPQNLMKKRIQQNKTKQSCYHQKKNAENSNLRSIVLLLLYIFSFGATVLPFEVFSTIIEKECIFLSLNWP